MTHDCSPLWRLYAHIFFLCLDEWLDYRAGNPLVKSWSVEHGNKPPWLLGTSRHRYLFGFCGYHLGKLQASTLQCGGAGWNWKGSCRGATSFQNKTKWSCVFFWSFGSYKGGHTTLGYSGRYFCRKNIVGINMNQSVQMVWDTVMAFHGLPVKSNKKHTPAKTTRVVWVPKPKGELTTMNWTCGSES